MDHPTFAELIKKLNRWAVSIEGKYVDLDGYPIAYKWQCHDVWLSYIVNLFGLPVTAGHAPGEGWTDAVWNEFPHHRPELEKHFVRRWGTDFRAGDVVFHAYGSWPYNLSHVTVALSVPRQDGTYLAMSQNPNPAKKMPVSTGGVVGFLRPRNSPDQSSIPKEDIMTPAQEAKLDRVLAAIDKLPAKILDTPVKRTGTDKTGKPRTGTLSLRGLIGSWHHQIGVTRRIVEKINKNTKPKTTAATKTPAK